MSIELTLVNWHIPLMIVGAIVLFVALIKDRDE